MMEQTVSPLKGAEVKLVMVVTYGCPQRCTYCVIRKYADVMTARDLHKGLEYVTNTRRSNVQIHFFGGEPLLMPLSRYRDAVAYGNRLAAERGKKIRWVLTTGAILLEPRNIDFMREHDFNLEISLDGGPETQNMNRPAVGQVDAYTMATRHLPRVFATGMDTHVSMVVSSESAKDLHRNFHHMLELGFKKIFVMTANGVDWTPEALRALKVNLDKLYPDTLSLIRSGRLNFYNIKDWQAPFRINTELAVSVEGDMTYTYNCCLVRDHLRPEFSMGHVTAVTESFDSMYDRRMTNEECIPLFFKHAIKAPSWLKNNIEAGMLMTRFVQALKDDLGIRDDLYRRNELYIKSYDRRMKPEAWFDPRSLTEAA